jgi:hypothetical protein
VNADVGTGADRRHRLRLGEDLGIGTDADFEILRPQAIGLQHVLDASGLLGARPHAAQVVPDDARDLAPHGIGARRVTACLLLDHALQHARDERHAGGLDRLQVARCEQARHGAVAVAVRLRERLRERADAWRTAKAANHRGDASALEQLAHRRRDRRHVDEVVADDAHDRRTVHLGHPRTAHEQRVRRIGWNARGRRKSTTEVERHEMRSYGVP